MKSKISLKLLIFFLLLTILVLVPSLIKKEPPSLQVSNPDSVVVLAENKSLTDKINLILENEQLEGAVVGVTVQNAQNGEVLFSHNGDIRLHPASNMKLLTGAAALETLGTAYRFKTEIRTDGELIGDTLHGNLYVKGKGDPTLLKADLDQFARDLKAQGIQIVNGNLVGDDTWYDNIRLSQDLNWSDEPFYTGAQVSALTLSPNEDYDAGTVIIEVTPADNGEGKAQIKIIPETDYVTIINHTKLVQAGESKKISVEREHGTNRIIVEGTIPKDGAPSQYWASVWEPAGYALSVFRDVLVEQGIQFVEESQDRFEKTPEYTQLLARKKSIPLSELLVPFMKLSNNGIAEVLTKEMGKQIHDEGTWEKGLAVIEDVVEELGVHREEILLRDGSGMSHKTLISSNNIAELLYKFQDKSWFETFKYSLPVAGKPNRFVGGTLRHRLTEEPVKGNVAAKTGLITGVSTLSGYVTSLDGEELVFSILINNYLGSNDGIQGIQDRIVTVLTEHEF